MSPTPSAISVLSFPEAGLPERLGPPPALDTAQQEVADELIQGPRRAWLWRQECADSNDRAK